MVHVGHLDDLELRHELGERRHPLRSVEPWRLVLQPARSADQRDRLLERSQRLEVERARRTAAPDPRSPRRGSRMPGTRRRRARGRSRRRPRRPRSSRPAGAKAGAARQKSRYAVRSGKTRASRAKTGPSIACASLVSTPGGAASGRPPSTSTTDADPLRLHGREQGGDEPAHRMAHQGHPVRADGVEHPAEVGRVLLQAVGRRQPVAARAAPEVRGDDPQLGQRAGERDEGPARGGDAVHREHDRGARFRRPHRDGELAAVDLDEAVGEAAHLAVHPPSIG